MTRRATFLTASLAAGALALASCGSPDEDPGSVETPGAASPTVQETNAEDSASPEPSPEATEAESDGDESSAPGADESHESEAESTPSEQASDHSPGTDESPESEQPEQDDLSGFSQETAATEDFPYTSGTWEEAQHLVEVRVGRHEGFDRVVFEHSGPSELAYQVEYIDQPTDQGMGAPIDVPGEAYLSISVSGIGFNPSQHDSDAVLSGPVEGVQTQSDLVQGIHALGTFESQSGYFIGLDQQRDFRVQMAEDPVRIIVDLAH
ncbi:AMIN-like domain-containing (lipo)protein [Nesterenkonia sandarakina]|uniref:AMIN-like domain-containing protein n=1 Tax=Nesterenkonia sandarakina TaxID=272918 RepID=A0A7Z0EAU8_9MICC|nr:hypothetical protein [Nesterenkonia sandarakina]NYJ18076.1 hypothetical protein [Nesterenkonia sandarakina]